MSSSGGATLDFGTHSTGTQWIQATNWSSLATNYSLLLNPNGGNVGIGTTSPLTLLETTGAIHAHDASQGPDNGYNGLIRVTRAPASGQYINLTRNGNVVWSLGTVYNSNTFAIGIGQATDSAFTAPTLSINTAGNVGIGTTSPSYMLHVNGSVAGVGAYNALSDIRYKKDVQSLAHSLAKILAIRGVTYKWIDEDKYGSQTQIGVIAQEIEKIVPEVVTTGSDGVKRVKYTDLIPLVIEAMQELNVDLGVLKAENERLKADSAILKAKSDKADARADKAETETATLKARADKADTEIRAKDAAVAQLKAESANLKAALCAKFSDLPICASNLAE